MGRVGLTLLASRPALSSAKPKLAEKGGRPEVKPHDKECSARGTSGYHLGGNGWVREQPIAGSQSHTSQRRHQSSHDGHAKSIRRHGCSFYQSRCCLRVYYYYETNDKKMEDAARSEASVEHRVDL
jgi:hypothetical protein